MRRTQETGNKANPKPGKAQPGKIPLFCCFVSPSVVEEARGQGQQA